MDNINRRDALLLICITLFGATLRLYHLGELSLWMNEDYLAISSKAILDFGYPIFPSGIIYPRALPFSYLAALSVHLFGFSEFSLRLPSALFSTLSIPLVYIFSRQIINRNTALLAAFIIAIFYWDIYAAHTARMYSIFTFFTLLSIVLVYAAEINDKHNLRIPAIASIIFAAFLHQIAIALLLMLLLFIPLLIAKQKSIWPIFLYATILAVSLAANYIFVTAQYNEWNELTAVSADSSQIIKEPLLLKIQSSALPLYTKLSTSTSSYRYALYLLLSSLMLWISIKIFSSRNKKLFYGFLGVIILLLTFQQFITAFITSMIFLIMSAWLKINLYRKDYYLLLSIFTLYLLFWLSYSLGTGETISLAIAKDTIKAITSYPPLFLRLYLSAYPWLTTLVIATSVYILSNTIKLKSFSESTFLLLMFFLPIMALSFHPQALERLYPRYIYFLSPYFIIILALGVNKYFSFCHRKWKQNSKTPALYYSILIPIFIFLSQGVSFERSYYYINSAHGENKHIFDNWLGKYNYQPDHRGPSMFVARNFRHGDIIITMDILAHFAYFPQADYQLTRSLKKDAEGWIGAQTIYTKEKLVDILNKNTKKRIWIITPSLRLKTFKNDEEFQNFVEIIQDKAGSPKFIGADKTSKVYCIGCS